MNEPVVWLDGKFVPRSQASVSVFDHGILYGDGCFEGIKSWDGRVFKLTQHIQRFFRSAKYLCINLPWTVEDVCQIVVDTVAENDLYEGVAYIRLVVTRGPGDLGINPKKCKSAPTMFCIASSIQLYPVEFYTSGIRCIMCSTRRNSVQALPAQVKSLNYLNNILGVIEANNSQAQEGIMLNLEGYVGEATADNVFFARDGVIKTPSIHLGILDGITRASIIEIAHREGYKVEEGVFATYDLLTADEVWLTGTGADLVPVVEIDTRIIGSGKPGPIFQHLRSLWPAYIAEERNHTVVPRKTANVV